MKRDAQGRGWRQFHLDQVLAGVTRIGKRRPAGASAGFFTVLDLGTTHLKAAVCRLERSGATLLGQAVEPCAVDWAAGSQEDVGVFLAACERALCRAEDMTEATAGQKIVADQAAIGLPAEALRLICHTAHYSRRSAAEPLTEAEIGRALQGAGRAALRKALPPAMPAGEWRLLPQAGRVQVGLDGHVADDLLGLRGGNLEVTFSLLLAPAALLARLEYLADQLKFDPPQLALSGQSVLTTWESALAGDGLGVDLGGRQTTLWVWRADQLQALAVAHQGGRDLTVALGRSSQIDEWRAEKLKLAYAEGQFDTGQRQWAGEVLRPYVERWREGIRRALGSVAASGPLPADVWLWGGSSPMQEAQRAVQEALLAEGAAFAGSPRLHLLADQPAPRVSDRTGLSMGAMGVNILALAGAAPAEAAPLQNQARQALRAAALSEKLPVWMPSDAR